MRGFIGGAVDRMHVPMFLDGLKVLGFDLETTGFDPRSERIVEFALVGSDVDGSHINIQSLVHPGRKIPQNATKVHGITDSDVRGVENFESHLKDISEAITDSVIVGHNVLSFDWRFLEMECMRAGVEVPIPRAILDTLVISRRLMIPGRHRLGDLCQKFGIPMDRAHRADADAGATLLLLWKIMRSYPEKFEGTLDDVVDSLTN